MVGQRVEWGVLRTNDSGGPLDREQQRGLMATDPAGRLHVRSLAVRAHKSDGSFLLRLTLVSEFGTVPTLFHPLRWECRISSSWQDAGSSTCARPIPNTAITVSWRGPEWGTLLRDLLRNFPVIVDVLSLPAAWVVRFIISRLIPKGDTNVNELGARVGNLTESGPFAVISNPAAGYPADYVTGDVKSSTWSFHIGVLQAAVNLKTRRRGMPFRDN